MDRKKFLAIIPARAGSKGILSKNVQLIGDKPMIQFTIEASIESVGACTTLVSSDDEKVHNILKKLGLKIPFVRPKALATDTAATADVIQHALDWYKTKHKALPENIILLQPTSPFRTAEDILNAMNFFLKSKKNTLVSVCDPMQHPGDFLIENMDKKYTRLEIGMNKDDCTGRQSYPNMLFIDGGIYISKTIDFLKTQQMIGDDPEIFKLQQSHAIDIDTPFDLEIARGMFLYGKH